MAGSTTGKNPTRHGHLSSPLFTKLPTEIRLMIYSEAFTGSCATIMARSSSSVPNIKPTDHNHLLFTCREVYEEARTTYWSQTAVCGTGVVRLGAILLTIPSYARPLIEHMRFEPREGSRMGACEFLGHFKRLRTLVLGRGLVTDLGIPDQNDKWLSTVAFQALKLIEPNIITWSVPRGITVLQSVRVLYILTDTMIQCFANYTTGEVFETLDWQMKDGEGFQKICEIYRPAEWPDQGGESWD